MLSTERIKPHHLERLAIVYVRQSSPHQVITNTESRRLQLALEQRAQQLGWKPGKIRVLEGDTAHTASTIEGRNDFQELVTLVATDQVGLLLAYDVQRLARNCTDWYPLLDVCAFRQCLIADGDGLYDPADANCRLLLGLKGQIAEWELHTLQRRCLEALEAKAQRGELAQMLPVGLERDEAGVVHKTADQEVQDRLLLVFDTFWRLKATTKTVRHLRQKGLSIPRQNQFGELVWRSPTTAAIGLILSNPAYAGAYVRGRTQPYRNQQGKLLQRRLPISQWRICLHDHYPAYISWERFEAIYAMLQDNYQEYDRNRTRGIPRPGKALLHGLMCCGQCGHKMVVQYKGGVRYICNYLRGQHQIPVCQWLPGDVIDEWAMHQFFSALSVAELDLYASSLEQADAEQARIAQAWQQQLQRLRYQEQLAQRQFLRADPDNRLVTGELERRWEEALRTLEDAEASWQREQLQQSTAWTLTPELRQQLEAAGEQMPELWGRENFLTQPQRKAMLRCLIDSVVAHRVAPDAVRARIVWRGGETTEATLPVPVGSLADLSFADDMERAIVRLAKAGKPDEEIATELTRKGYRSPLRVDEVLPSTVRTIRLKHGLLQKSHQSHPRRVPGSLTVPQLAKRLGVSVHWIYDRIHNGTIRIKKDVERNTYLFPDKLQTLKRLRQLREGKVQELDF